MATIENSSRILGPRKAKTISIRALIALLGILAMALLIGPLSPSHPAAEGSPLRDSSEPWLEINCLENVVEEGDDFRLIVNKKFNDDWPYKKMRVFWYTDPITADETDYERLHAEGQASNGYQSKHGRMGRNFHTLEDNYPEIDETFLVRFNNSNDEGHDGECIIAITDDDGVGIFDLEITSTPHELPASDGQDSQVGYAVDDIIEITAHFTGAVTTVNPDTGERADYAGIYIQVGENRRFAPFLRNYGADALAFGYMVQADDLDADGISVEGGGPGTGLGYNPDTRDGGIWIVENGSSRINRLFHGLDDDPAHPVFQIEIDEPTITPPTETEIPPVPQPEPDLPVWVEKSVVIENGAFHIEHGELTEEDGGRDWFSFTGIAGEDYIIEVESRMDIGADGSTPYVEGKLIDPSILEIVNEQGEQMMGEQDGGGFTSLWARGYFIAPEDGNYYIAVGNGNEDPYGTGHYTISVRQDDHADDFRTRPDVVIRPGESITATINSDVAPDDPRLNPWDWKESDEGSVPLWGIESRDDQDVFRFQIDQKGAYRFSVSDGPPNVGIWWASDWNGNGIFHHDTGPVESTTHEYQPGTYYFAVGTPYQSVGNTGDYTVSLTAEPDDNGEDATPHGEEPRMVRP